jgi:hypothetical protein
MDDGCSELVPECHEPGRRAGGRLIRHGRHAEPIMSTSQLAENVVDFAAYRARRDQRLPPHAAANDAPWGPVFMLAVPVMIPIFGWMPVWTSANVVRVEGLSE